MQQVATLVRPAILSGWLYIPYEVIGGRLAIQRMKDQLTFRPRFQDPDAPKQIEMFHDWTRRDYLGVPRAWGLRQFRGRLPLLDKTTKGAHEISVPRLPDFYHPRVLNPDAQKAFHDGLVRRFHRSRGFIGKAGTGTGKTVVSLRVAADTIKRPTLILLHLERLMYQWYDEIGDKLGVPADRIGMVQSNTCEFEGKDFVVGMLHSVAQRNDYPKEFYRHFGHVIYDEVHKIGTQFFAPVVYKFPSYNWLGLSATVERPDAGEKVFFNHLGNIEVTSEAEAMPMDIFPMRYLARGKLWGNTPTSRQKCLAEDMNRNRWMAGLIKRAYDKGRNFLAVSYSVPHLQTMIELCAELGIPREHMGQYTGQRHGGPFCPLAYGEDGKPRAIRDPKTNRVVIDSKKKDIPNDELDHVKKNAKIVFATYGMITEGIDEPRWDAGMDLTPRGKATQLIGRLRRPLPNKPRPFWMTPFDAKCSMSKKMFGKRCRDYRSTNATIKEIR